MKTNENKQKEIASGVWPTVITPFDENNNIDYHAIESLLEWYINRNVAGIFTVSQSSEMFYLSLEERKKLARRTLQMCAGRKQVIASGHISDSIKDQIREINEIIETGVDGFVLVNNRFAQKEEGDCVWKKNVEKILASIPDNVMLGLYECPFPYKRIITEDTLEWCVQTGRFFFLKDTSSDLEIIKKRARLLKNKKLKLFNANAATFLVSMQLGYAGYCGVMGNFHPQLYNWMITNYDYDNSIAEKLQDFLGVASLIEGQLYPVNAKYFLTLEGIEMNIASRVRNAELLSSSQKCEIQQLQALTNRYSQSIFERGAGNGNM